MTFFVPSTMKPGFSVGFGVSALLPDFCLAGDAEFQVSLWVLIVWIKRGITFHKSSHEMCKDVFDDLNQAFEYADDLIEELMITQHQQF